MFCEKRTVLRDILQKIERFITVNDKLYDKRRRTLYKNNL
jgi:hypothetical protein